MNGIICDLDKTLALLGERDPYDASTCELDTLNEPIALIVRLCVESGIKLIITSGRKEKHREATERWLIAHNIHPDLLLLRANDDQRRDRIVKQEMYERHIQGKYHIHFVLDDRQQVVDLWRSLGLVCLQVSEGSY